MPVTPETDINDRGWVVEGAGELLRVYPGIAIAPVVRAKGPLASAPVGGDPAVTTTTHAGNYLLAIEAAYAENLGHYTLRTLALEAAGDDDVTGAVLRTVAPLAVMRWFLPRTFEIEPSKLSVPVVDFIAPELKQYRRPSTVRQAPGFALEDIGTIYSVARIVRYPPAKAVAETLELQQRTATNWIAKARSKGLL